MSTGTKGDNWFLFEALKTLGDAIPEATRQKMSLISGLGLVVHGMPRKTEDINFAVPGPDVLDEIFSALEGATDFVVKREYGMILYYLGGRGGDNIEIGVDVLITGFGSFSGAVFQPEQGFCLLSLYDMLIAKARAAAERDSNRDYTDLRWIVNMMVEKSVVIEHEQVTADFYVDMGDVLRAWPQEGLREMLHTIGIVNV